ncbi:MAG: murein biosynthesis integral membrane protein MurJ [Pseudomonadota bacterium]|nr:murein biosynthesis integral membrane protein MurJ [Pseudomonadota bacterium]
MSLHSSIATVGGCTAISRVVGFIREVLLARYLGAGMMADAFFVALRFPNLFRSLFAEGTLNVAFVPLFSGELQAHGKQRALAFARSVFGFLFYVLLIFTVVMEILMPCLMFILAPGFEKIAGKLALTTSLSRITFPFLLCVSLVSLFSGILNSAGKFWAAAFTPTLLNIIMVGFLICLTPFINSPYAPAYALAWGVFVAGIVEFLFLFWHLRKIKMTFGLIGPVKALCHMTKGVKLLLKKMAPGVLGSGVYQINLFLDTLFVSFVGAGAISWLNYANHLFQLPIGVIGVAIGTVLLPVLSRYIKSGEADRANAQLNRGLEVSMALAISSMIGLILLATPIVGILFEHGRFTRSDTLHTAKALTIFALGLPAYMMTKTLAPFFYARGDTTTPVKIAVVGVVLNAIMAITFMSFWGYAGIALATSISVWINAAQYMFRLAHRGDFRLDAIFKYRMIRIIASGVIMGIFIGGIKQVVALYLPNWEHGGGVLSILILAGIIGVGCVAFLGVLILSGGIPMKQIKAILAHRSLSE